MTSTERMMMVGVGDHRKETFGFFFFHSFPSGFSYSGVRGHSPNSIIFIDTEPHMKS